MRKMTTKLFVATSALIAISVLSFQNCTGLSAASTASGTSATSIPNNSNVCLPSLVSNCLLGVANANQSSGNCASNYTGSCSYACVGGSWKVLSNTCQLSQTTPSPTPASCPSQTINNCNIGGASSGASVSGQCPSGYTGSCTAACSNGTWSVTANSCAPPPVPKKYVCTFDHPNVYYFPNTGISAPLQSQQPDTASCANWCASQGAALCQYTWVNYVYYCSAYTAAQLADAYPQDFYGIEASGACAYQ